MPADSGAPRVFLRTYGCRANQYDSEVVRQMVAQAGARLVDAPQDADVAVFNSCAVTAAAESDLRRGVRSAARRRPGLRTVIMGCAAALDRPELAELPSVAAVVPGADLPAIARALGLPDAAAGVVRRAQPTARGLLRIQDGCDEHCTFCATTIARGANRSRTVVALLAEARELAEQHTEIVITGIHIGSYGRDCGSSLGELVQQLAAELPQVRWRLSSVEASEVDDRLGALLRDGGTLAPHLHAPLQSGADRLLRRMGRHWYTADQYARAVERLLDGRAAFGLGADLITGFPGETDEDHRATLALVARLPFSYLHVFPWSPRPGTAAERLPGRVAPGLAHERAAELRELGARRAAAYRLARVAAVPEADVVVIGRAIGSASGDGAHEGLTGDYLPVSFHGPAPPRRTRWRCRLSLHGDRLLAHPLHPVGPVPASVASEES